MNHNAYAEFTVISTVYKYTTTKFPFMITIINLKAIEYILNIKSGILNKYHQ